jgi:predicted peptidase
MLTRRETVLLLSGAPITTWISAQTAFSLSSKLFASASVKSAKEAKDDSAPTLAPGAPNSPERLALIEAFKKQSDGLDQKYEARNHKSTWTMPYRLFRPQASGKLPLVVYLHGSGGLGDDNLKQLGLGNIFGTRVWLLPENQKNFPCYVLAPQTDRGWAHYDFAQDNQPAKLIPGLGDGARLVFEIIDSLCRDLPIDDRRIYLTGQSMGGRGTWHMTAQRKNFFAAAVPCCGGDTAEDAVESLATPLWVFHGEADQTVPVKFSRVRVAALRKAGGHPLYTEYAGVDHNVWEWAYTEPELPKWMFAQRRG